MNEVTEYKQEDDGDMKDTSEESFVLIKLAGRKSVSYFMAQVVKDLDEGEMEVKYYKRYDASKFILEKDCLYDW